MMRARVLSLFLRPTTPPLWLGVVVAASLIVVETFLVLSLKQIAPENAFGALFLLGVLVVSAGWGFGLALLTTLASAVVYTYFHLGSDGGFLPSETRDWIAIAIFLPVALLANGLVGQARLRAAEADRRRREADAAAELAHREQERLHEAQRSLENSRDELRALAEQQAALRRVATLVARGVGPSDLFSAVADELAVRLGVQHSALVRFEPDGAALMIATHDEPALTNAAIERFPPEDGGVAATVYRTGRTARLDSHDEASGPAAVRVRQMGLRSAVGAPIIVGGRVWGAALVGSSRLEPLPPDTESRVGDFADLIATAISNAEARAQLTASRARIVAASDDGRRRLERDLHDGTQQRLVSLGLELRTAEASLRSDRHPVADEISDIVAALTGVSEELREISRGIHPAILSRGGLGEALKALARRSPVPVELHLGVERRLPESVEVAAYYVVAEALTNTAKYAQASDVNIRLETDGANLRMSIQDDGIGGADPAKGSGLIGLIDRVEAVGGQLEISSVAHGGTLLLVSIPVDGPAYH